MEFKMDHLMAEKSNEKIIAAKCGKPHQKNNLKNTLLLPFFSIFTQFFLYIISFLDVVFETIFALRFYLTYSRSPLEGPLHTRNFFTQYCNKKDKKIF